MLVPAESFMLFQLGVVALKTIVSICELSVILCGNIPCLRGGMDGKDFTMIRRQSQPGVGLISNHIVGAVSEVTIRSLESQKPCSEVIS